jgi:hypothetical protein
MIQARIAQSLRISRAAGLLREDILATKSLLDCAGRDDQKLAPADWSRSRIFGGIHLCAAVDFYPRDLTILLVDFALLDAAIVCARNVGNHTHQLKQLIESPDKLA